MDGFLGLVVFVVVHIYAIGITRYGWYPWTYIPRTHEGRFAARSTARVIAALIFVGDALFLGVILLWLAGIIQ